MTMTKNKLYHMVLAGILCAIGIVVPMFMPRIVLGPMSFTLASHVAVFLGMFISPAVAVAVCIGTTIGFFLTTPAIIALRAASHIVFAFIGAAYLQRNPDIINRPVAKHRIQLHHCTAARCRRDDHRYAVLYVRCAVHC